MSQALQDLVSGTWVQVGEIVADVWPMLILPFAAGLLYLLIDVIRARPNGGSE